MLSLLLFCLSLLQPRLSEARNVGHSLDVRSNETETSTMPLIMNDLNKIENTDETVTPIIMNDHVIERASFWKTNPDRVYDLELFEKDIMLTKEQMLERKGTAFSSKLWPEEDGERVVPYRFVDPNIDKTAVLAGIEHWEANTCIMFRETTIEENSLLFVKEGGCWSYIGYVSQFSSGQKVSIDDGCASLGIVTHEIGHALGFYHEQSRPDRDSKVHINYGNIQEGKEGNFDSYSTSIINNRNIPYDLTSNMHYGGRYFSSNGHNTIVTLDPRDQELIGSANELSHMDIFLANVMYGCIDKWVADCNLQGDPCQNDGFISSNCSCVCPEGTTGQYCETVMSDYYASKRSDCNEIVTTPKTISSPNYPQNYPNGLTCAKVIRAPDCMTPKVTFEAFHLYNHSTCYWDALEIRTNNAYDGERYCAKDISPGEVFTSSTSELVLMFYTYTNYYSGWSATVSFDPIVNCDTATSSNTTTSTTSSTTTSTSTTSSTTTSTSTTSSTTTTTSTTSSTTTSTTTTTTTTTTTSTTTTTTTSTTTTSTTTAPNPECGYEYDGDIVNWSSPNFGIENYPHDFECSLTGYSEEPMMTQYSFNTFKLQKKVGRRRNKRCVDFVRINLPYQMTRKLCNTKTGTYNVPGQRFESIFRTDSTINDIGFNITVSKVVNDCHTTVVLSDPGNSEGIFTSPNYPSDYPENAACEWRFVAPEGRRVRVELNNVSFTSSKCKHSYIVIDKSGSGDYLKGTSKRLCKSGYIAATSAGEVMHVAFFGGHLPSSGFNGTYSLLSTA